MMVNERIIYRCSSSDGRTGSETTPYHYYNYAERNYRQSFMHTCCRKVQMKLATDYGECFAEED